MIFNNCLVLRVMGFWVRYKFGIEVLVKKIYELLKIFLYIFCLELVKKVIIWYLGYMIREIVYGWLRRLSELFWNLNILV